MTNVIKLVVLLALFGMLILIRAFENEVFYDPYILFFKNDYLYLDNPQVEVFKLTLFTVLRYLLNSAISLAIIYIFFKDRSVVEFSAFIYGVGVIILLPLFLYFVINPRQEDYFMLFNIRRFLIQPILLLLLLPAFYYHKLKSKKT